MCEIQSSDRKNISIQDVEYLAIFFNKIDNYINEMTNSMTSYTSLICLNKTFDISEVEKFKTFMNIS